MGNKSRIEWTDRTWNPITGCAKVSPGCKNCYAETIAKRFWKGRKFTDVRCHEDRLDQPLRWRQPSRVFVNSMSDLFHEDVPDDFMDRVFAVMGLCPQHTFQVLTKRPERMLAHINGLADRGGTGRGFRRLENAARTLGRTLEFQGHPLLSWPIPNIWLGCSVEDQYRADERIPLLLQTPAAVRFLSCEPLLGPIDLSAFFFGINWVIVGSESGPHRRPMKLEWADSLMQQCRVANVAFFMKQCEADGKVTGDLDKFPARIRVREFPSHRRPMKLEWADSLMQQ